MIWLFVVLALAIIWVLLRQRTPSRPRPKPLPDPRALLAQELQQAAAAARDEARYDEAQSAELRAAWLRSDPPLGQDAPPSNLDPGIKAHLQFADEVRRRYAAALSRADEYADCTYKPVALLPFSKEPIRRAMELLIGIGEGSVYTPHVTGQPFAEAELTTMKRSVSILDNFLEAPPDAVPRVAADNESFGRKFLDSTAR